MSTRKKDVNNVGTSCTRSPDFLIREKDVGQSEIWIITD